MARSTLKKILTQADVRAAIAGFHQGGQQPFRIENKQGEVLLEFDGGHSSDRYPIQVNGSPFGWVCGDASVQPLAAMLACLVRQELEKKSLARELLERYQELDLFFEISTQVTASLDLQQLSKLVLKEVRTAIPLQSCAIWLCDGETADLQRLMHSGQSLPWPNPLKLEDSLLGDIVRQGRGEIVNQVSDDPRATSKDRQVASLLAVPLAVRGRTIGLIGAVNDRDQLYTTEHLKRLTLFAMQTAIAIEKALLYEQSRQAATRAQEQTRQLQQALQELRQAQTQLVQSEKMSSLGQMVAGVAHEINNPVNFINGNLSHACDYTQDLLDLVDLYCDRYPDPTDDIEDFIEDIDLEFLRTDLPKLLASMKLGIDRIREIVSSLKNFSRLDRDRPQLADLHGGLDSTLLILNNRLKAKGDRPEVTVRRDYSQLPKVECFAGQLNQVFVNAIANAIEAMEDANTPNPTIWIRTAVRDEGWVSIEIADNGPGMSEAVQQQIYDPFFTTKPIGRGTGLGLAISRQIVVERHGGQLHCRSHPGRGTQFEILLPVEACPRAVSPSKPSNGEAINREVLPIESNDISQILPLAQKTPLSDEEETRYQQLVERLARYNPDLRNLTPDRMYQMLMSMPILLQLYLASLGSPLADRHNS